MDKVGGQSGGDKGAVNIPKEYPAALKEYCLATWPQTENSFFDFKVVWQDSLSRLPQNLLDLIQNTPSHLKNSPHYLYSALSYILHKSVTLVFGESETDAACRRVFQKAHLNQVDPLGHNIYTEALKDQQWAAANVYEAAGAHIYQRDHVNFTSAAHLLASQFAPASLESYLEKKSHLASAQDFEGRTPTHVAVMVDNPEALKVLIEQRADVNIRDSSGKAPIHLAAQHSLESFKLLLEYFLTLPKPAAMLQIRDQNGAGVWHYAALGSQHRKIMGLLRLHKIAGNQQDLQGQTAMHYAASQGNVAAIESLHRLRVKKDVQDLDGNTPLHLAARQGHANAVQKLVSVGYSLSKANLNKRFPIHEAASSGDLDVVESLLYYGAHIESKDARGETPLYLAASLGNSDALQRFLDAGADVNAISNNGKSALYNALKLGNLESSNLLQEQGALLQADPHKKCALHIAIAKGDYELTQLHLLEGSSLLERDADDHSPLMVALLAGNSRIARSLIELEADLNVLDLEDRTAMHVAASYADSDTILAMLEKGAVQTPSHKDGKLPLHIAVIQSNDEAFPVLLRYLKSKSDINIADHEGKTALHYAVLGKKQKMAELLIKAGAVRSLADQNRQSPLHLAAITGHQGILQLLTKGLQQFHEINMRDKKGHTPLYYASKFGNSEGAELLKQLGGVVLVSNYDSLQQATLNQQTQTVLELLNDSHLIKRGPEDKTALSLAIEVGNHKIASIILQNCNKSIINYRDLQDETPVHHAVRGKQIETLIELIQMGADVNAKNDQGQAPLHLAAMQGNIQALDTLALAGANMNPLDHQDRSPLRIATQLRNEEFITAHLELGGRLNPSQEMSAFFHLIEHAKFEKVQDFLMRGVNIEARDSAGQTGLHYAVTQSDERITQSLIRAGFDLTAIDNEGKTPLHTATIHKNGEAIKLLFKAKAPLDRRDLRGRIALDIARKNQDRYLIKILTAGLN